MRPTTGGIWLADLGAEVRRPVVVVSDERFHRLAGRALVAPVLATGPTHRNPPWWIPHEGSAVALERLTSIPAERLLEPRGTAPYSTVRAAQRAIGWLTGSDH